MSKLRIGTLWFIPSLLVFSVTITFAADFDWTKNLNVSAKADPYGFRAQLSTRFNIGDAEIRIVLDNVDRPSDAYMIFRLGEMSSCSVDYVLSQYKAQKNKGWGPLAKSLGIKPGSREFHALKQGNDLYAYGNSGKGQKNKNKGKKKG